MSEGKPRFVGMDAAVQQAEFFKRTLKSLGLEVVYERIDDTDYYVVPAPEKSRRRLVYNIDTGKQGQGTVVLDLDYVDMCTHRLVWEEGVGFLYEFDHSEPEQNPAEGLALMEAFMGLLGRRMAVGEELPISMEEAEMLILDFALHFITMVTPRKGGAS